LERTGYLLSTVVVARSSGLAERVQSMTHRPVAVIPDGFDASLLPPDGGRVSRQRWGWTADHLVVGVVGSAAWNRQLSWCYGRDVLEVVARTQRTDVRGALIVRGDGIPKLKELATRLGVAERVVFETPRDGYAVYEQIRGFDVGLSTQTNDAVGQCRTTGKLVQYLAAGVYVLASRVGEAARILPDAMTVPYRGAWDGEYFSRLADRVDRLPARTVCRQIGAEVGRSLRPRFEYTTLKLELAKLLGAPGE
jgi:glycosyltransferase involved in cell wall biosynthesis